MPAAVAAELPNETDTVETNVDDKNNKDETHEGVPAADVRNNNHEHTGDVHAAVVAELPNDSSESSYHPPGNSSSPSSASQSVLEKDRR